ncbi:ArnT family glycosyltransferase [Hymenobacter persicinus]|uniref:Glycosyl transferase n=1 Tax=Hymenobacter persicinus TaxID=2025506 RepID=A0A4Q5L8S5_9BACT|nr:glycosyl transferase [Hymenobacter persicinus]RYU78098.1 glycosyl transferase [Hymenobacter persicinus]
MSYPPAFSRRRSPLGRVVAVLVVCVFSFFVNAGAPEVSLMEARNFVAAREIVAGGSWLLPTMNGELRLAKPPLPTWAVAALQHLTGPTENLALLRLPAALMATLLVFCCWGLARQLTANLPGEAAAPGRTAWLSALVVASSLLVVTTGREGQWDIFANGFLVGALGLLVRGWRGTGPGYASFAGAGLLLGLSILSKGPVALYGVLLPFVGSYLVSPPLGAGIRTHGRGALLAAAVALAVGVSWPLYVYWHVQPMALAVAQTEVTAWRERHVQPPWYYWNFFAFSGVWAAAALAALVVPYARPRLQAFVPYRFVLGWLVVALLLLSFVPEKKERYMLPLLPPLALLIAGMLRSWETSFARPHPARADRAWLRFWAGVLTLVCAAVPVTLAVVRLPDLTPGTVRFGLALLLGALLAAVALWAGWQLRPRPLMATSLALMSMLLGLLLPAYPRWEARRAEAGLHTLRAARLRPALRQLPWYSLEEMPVKQVWAAGRSVPLWKPATDSLPLQQLPVAVFSSARTLAQLPARWRQHLLVEAVDSFYLGRQRKDGRWFISVLRPR